MEIENWIPKQPVPG